MKSGKVVLGILAGLSAGALLGILFAPDKGSATRKKISDKGGEYADDLKNKFNEFIESFSGTVEDLKKEGRQYAEKGKEYAEKGKAKFDEMKSTAKTSAQQHYSSQG